MKDHDVIVSDTVRRNVEEDLTMLKEIRDPELKRLVIEAWATSLTLNGFSAVHELQGSGMLDLLVLKEGTQADHLNLVAKISLAVGKALKEQCPDYEIDFDLLVAGGLLHDVGKPPEYNPENLKKWAEAPYREGNPPVSHAMYGYYICMLVGLPLRVAHIPAAHDQEGEMYSMQRSLEAMIVHYADGISWFAPMALGKLDTRYPFSIQKTWPFKKPGEA